MNVFWLSQPDIYFEGAQILIVFLALYMALWLTNFLITARSAGWILITLLPGVLSIANYIYIIRTAALLKAIYKVSVCCVCCVCLCVVFVLQCLQMKYILARHVKPCIRSLFCVLYTIGIVSRV